MNELSETEKQTVSTLATVAAGLAGGLVETQVLQR
ncbi:VENN motif pre-toxin domain-containing protein [Escherichia coli]|nr:VENN motif pre-toxin domain-containing protein [Escherichia coli]